MEWAIVILIVMPAVVMALTRSSWLMDYAILVLAFNRGIRRVVDYYVNGQFNPLSPISLTPLLVVMLLAIPAVTQIRRLTSRVQQVFLLLGGAIALGFTVGLIQNRLAAIYGLAEWSAGLAAMLFAASQPVARQTADRWIKTAGWAAVGIAVYGWWQYYTIPAWDAMWLVQSGMQGYMGEPEPTKMTVFSTMNERGPCGSFLAWAAIPMIISANWRNIGGWASVGLLLSVILLTQTRSSLILVVVTAAVYPAVARGRGGAGLIMLTILGVAAMTHGMERIPGVARMSERFEGESLYGESSSLKGRFGIYRDGFSALTRKPFGMGLGSSGMGKRLEGEDVEMIGDCGYLQIFAQFGWLGAAFFYGALWLIWKEVGQRWRWGMRHVGGAQMDPLLGAVRAVLISALVILFVGDIFAGFSLVWVFFGLALNRSADPRWIARRKLEGQARMVSSEEAIEAPEAVA